MHEDQLAQQKEVVEGSTHPKQEGDYADEESQDSTAPEQVEQVP